MDASYIYDDEAYEDLDDYSIGSFMYGGEIYLRIGASDSEINKELQLIYYNHPSTDIRIRAIHMAIIMLIRNIYKKHC